MGKAFGSYTNLILLAGAALLVVMVLGKKTAETPPPPTAPAFVDPLMSSPYGNVSNDDRPAYHVGQPSI